MPPTLSQTTTLPTSSQGRRGADARSLFLVSASSDRASETLEQSAASVEDILRRTPDFAEPGEMERREREEASAHAVSLVTYIGVTLALIGLVALATALLMGWAV